MGETGRRLCEDLDLGNCWIGVKRPGKHFASSHLLASETFQDVSMWVTSHWSLGTMDCLGMRIFYSLYRGRFTYRTCSLLSDNWHTRERQVPCQGVSADTMKVGYEVDQGSGRSRLTFINADRHISALNRQCTTRCHVDSISLDGIQCMLQCIDMYIDNMPSTSPYIFRPFMS